MTDEAAEAPRPADPAEASPAQAPPVGRRAWLDRLDWAQLETPSLTASFWTAAGVFALAYWLTPFPPCIDYPQHLALGAILRRLFDPAAPEHATYVATLLTYNGLFHVLVATLALVVPVEIAGKLLLSLVPVLTASAALAIVDVARRPRWYAAFVLPISYSYIVGWGFINYALFAPVAMLTFAWWVRWRDGERRVIGWVIGGALTVAYAHVLAMLCLCISVGVATVARQWPREVGVRRWLRELLSAPWPILPAAAYAVVVYLVHRRAPHIYWEPWKDGTDVPAWQKLWNLSSFAVGNLGSPADRVIFLLSLGLIAVLFVVAAFMPPAPTAPRTREISALALTWFLLYLITPRVFMSTWWIFERLPLFWLVFLVAATPRVDGAVVRLVRGAIVAAGLALSITTARAFASIPDARDADAIIDDIPAGSRVIAVMHGVSAAPAVWREMWVHQLAYFVVRRRGEIAFDFTRYASLPVRRRDAGEAPPRFPSGLEWLPDRYDPRAAYAAYFPWVLVRSPDEDPASDPRWRTFGAYGERVTLVSHRGRFWLFDASAIHGASTADGG
ncbi:MAG: hypothetical protein JW751_09895 [Polyangiaceae bacterium]|nr:hypothetical protein [Polyangiaceae bacterium]